MDLKEINFLKEKAEEIRKLIFKEICTFGSGHIGGCLSIADVLAVIYFKTANVDPKNPKMADRDRVVLSKGHAGPGLYACLCAKGYFDESVLLTLNQPGTKLPSHCDMNKVVGVDMTAGSLGQGFSCAVGMALAAKMDKKKYNVYCIIGDGESQEGQIWEAAMYAGSHQLNNLIIFVDDNKMQIDGPTAEVNNVEPLDEKFKAFNFDTVSIDGHNAEEIYQAIDNAKRSKEKRPHCIILNTIKAKGMPEYEGKPSSHSVSFTPELIKKYKGE